MNMSNTINRNICHELDLDWVMSTQANQSAIERRAATLGTRRSVKKEFQAAWLARAISCIDLTTLSGDDTEGACEDYAPKRGTHCGPIWRNPWVWIRLQLVRSAFITKWFLLLLLPCQKAKSLSQRYQLDFQRAFHR